MSADVGNAISLVAPVTDLPRAAWQPLHEPHVVHRSAVRRLQEKHSWLQAEFLPPYAPDLNPVEAMWSYTKHCDLANYIPNNVSELEDEVLDSLAAQNYDQRLKQAYFKRAGLDL